MADPAVGTVQDGYRFVGGAERWHPLTGEDFLDWVSQTKGPEVAAQVRQYASGEFKLPSSRSPLYQQIMPYLLRFDPGASEATFGARAAARKYYTVGKGAEVLAALGTLGRHGVALSNAVEGVGNLGPDALDNRPKTAVENLGFGMLFGGTKNNNGVAHGIADATGTGERLVALRQARDIFGTELARVLQGGVPNEGEIRQQRENFNEDGSPDEMRRYVRQSVEAAVQRLEEQDGQFQRANGLAATGGLTMFDFMDPKVVAAMRELAARGTTGTKVEGLTGYRPPAFPGGSQVTPRTAAAPVAATPARPVTPPVSPRATPAARPAPSYAHAVSPPPPPPPVHPAGYRVLGIE